jgi:hypothetical protein
MELAPRDQRDAIKTQLDQLKAQAATGGGAAGGAPRPRADPCAGAKRRLTLATIAGAPL